MTEGRTEKKAAWKEDKTVSRQKGRKEVCEGRMYMKAAST